MRGRVRRSLPLLALLTLSGALPVRAAWSPLGGPVTPTINLQLGSGRLLYARASNESPSHSFLWRSEDGGATWHDIQPGLGRPVSALAIDSADPRVIWAWTPGDQLWRSSDAGDTWSLRSVAEGDVTQAIQLLADPRHPGTLYRVDAGFEGPFVSLSRDGGATFTEGVPLSQFFSTLNPVRLQPNRGRILSFTVEGLVISRDGGASWQLRGRYLGSGFNGGDFAPAFPDTLYGLSANGVQCLARSDDGGASWRSLAPPVASSDSCESVAVDPRDPRHVWIGVQTSTPDGRPLTKEILESSDGGATWSSPFTKPAGDLLAAGGETLYVQGGSGGGLSVSRDGGRTWLGRGRGIAGGDLRSGLVAQRLPSGGRRLVALDAAGDGAVDAVVYRSDGGRDWTATPIRPVAIAGAGGSTVVAAGDGGGQRSLDAGTTWDAVPSAPPGSQSLLSDLAKPQFLALVAFENTGPYGTMAFWTSDDAGATWRRTSNGLPIECGHQASVDSCPDFAAYAVDPFDPRRRWVAFTIDLEPIQPTIFTTTDGGASWQAQETQLSITHALAADPAVPGRLLAGTDTGLFASPDGGAHWTPLSDLPAGAVIRQFARDGGAWYAATTAAGIFRSTDGGAHWTLLAGAPDLDNPTIAVDPRRPTALLAAFGGQGLWRWTP